MLGRFLRTEYRFDPSTLLPLRILVRADRRTMELVRGDDDPVPLEDSPYPGCPDCTVSSGTAAKSQFVFTLRPGRAETRTTWLEAHAEATSEDLTHLLGVVLDLAHHLVQLLEILEGRALFSAKGVRPAAGDNGYLLLDLVTVTGRVLAGQHGLVPLDAARKGATAGEPRRTPCERRLARLACRHSGRIRMRVRLQESVELSGSQLGVEMRWHPEETVGVAAGVRDG